MKGDAHTLNIASDIVAICEVISPSKSLKNIEDEKGLLQEVNIGKRGRRWEWWGLMMIM